MVELYPALGFLEESCKSAELEAVYPLQPHLLTPMGLPSVDCR